MGDPWVSAAAQVTTTLAPFAFTLTRGLPARPGLPAGVTTSEARLAGESPTALEATTVNVYDVPFVNPFTVADEAPPPTLADAPPGAAVTV